MLNFCVLIIDNWHTAKPTIDYVSKRQANLIVKKHKYIFWGDICHFGLWFWDFIVWRLLSFEKIFLWIYMHCSKLRYREIGFRRFWRGDLGNGDLRFADAYIIHFNPSYSQSCFTNNKWRNNKHKYLSGSDT